MYDFTKDIERLLKTCRIHKLVDPQLQLTMRLLYLRGAIAACEACHNDRTHDVLRALLKEVGNISDTSQSSPGDGSTSNAKGDTAPPTP